MKTIKSKLLAMGMAGVMVFAMAPLTGAQIAYANEGEIGYDFDYEEAFESDTMTDPSGVTYAFHDDGTASVIGYDADLLNENVVIPYGIALIDNHDGVHEYRITEVADRAFEGCSIMTDLQIQEGGDITSIGRDAFSECANLKSVYIAASVETIGRAAFAADGSLTTVTFGDYSNLKDIGYEAFYCCSDLANFEIPEEVTSIGGEAFLSCNYLPAVTIPAGVTTIEEDTFAYAGADRDTFVVSFAPGSQLENIKSGAFRNCYYLPAIELPDSVKSIAENAFANCFSLGDIIMSANVQAIGEGAFSLGGSATMHYLGDENQWDAMTISNTWNSNANIAVHFAPVTVTKATPTADGSIDYLCAEGDWIRPIDTISKPSGLKLSATAYTYDGKAKKPTVTVTDANGQKLGTGDYDVAYENCTNAGKATAKVTFKGSYYEGTATATYTIKAAKAAVPAAKALTYNGKEQTGVAAGKNYTITGNKGTKAGSYTAVIKLKDKKNYTWADGTTADKKVAWKIKKAANTMTVKAKTATVQYKNLKKKAQTFDISKGLTVSKAKGKVTYKKVSGNKKISVSAAGKVTVQKKLKKGTYNVKVNVTAAGNANFNKLVKPVTFKVTVK